VVRVGRGAMPDRTDELRKRAEDCVAVARTMTDPGNRAILLAMAQGWYHLADGFVTNVDAILPELNDRQMSALSRPVAQQQQQIQPEKEEDE
jgi:hypothetical protein